MEKEKDKKTLNKKTTTLNNNKENQTSFVKKKSLVKNNSNVKSNFTNVNEEEFAFNITENEEKFSEYTNFLTNYEEIISGLKNLKVKNMNKNNSDPKGEIKKKSFDSLTNSSGAIKKKYSKKNHSANFNEFTDNNNYISTKDTSKSNIPKMNSVGSIKESEIVEQEVTVTITEKRSDSQKSQKSNKTNKTKKSKDSKKSCKSKNSKNSNNKTSVGDLVTQVNQNEGNEKLDNIENYVSIEEIKDYYEYAENCLKIITKLIQPPIENLENLMVELPEKYNKKKLAIFDLDETLIHCELKQPQKAERIINITLPNKKKARVSSIFYLIF